MVRVIHDYLAELSDLIDLARDNFSQIQDDIEAGGRQRGMSQFQYQAAMGAAVNAHACVNALLCVLREHIHGPEQPRPQQNDTDEEDGDEESNHPA